jgi:hypothetical protein
LTPGSAIAKVSGCVNGVRMAWLAGPLGGHQHHWFAASLDWKP